MNKFENVKIVVTVPKSHLEVVLKTLGDSGAGRIGLYSHCSYASDGLGRFLPLEGAKPFIGEVLKFEEVDEVRVEVTCKVALVKGVISELRKVHPYEEPAIDIYPLLDLDL